jgi:putative ABC transport system substrate-binding protein
MIPRRSMNGALAVRRVVSVVSFTLAVALAAAPQPATAQDGKLPRVGWLASGSVAGNTGVEEAFVHGLRDLGYVDGQNFLLETRFTGGIAAQYSALAAELIRLNVDVIVASGPRCEAAFALTKIIPIVCPTLNDPVARGVVASFNHPGGNVTGVLLLSPELFHKRFQILKEAIPRVARVGVLWVPESEWLLREAESAARVLKLEIEPKPIGQAADFEPAFEALSRSRVDAVVTTQGPLFSIHRPRISELGLRHKVPTMSGETGFAAMGGFMEFGRDLAANWHRAATFVDKILKGAKAAELPIEQPAPRLVVNLKTARALGITVPQSILLRADEVIE